jgi:tRNA(fMet)-specific endonuclease VapC
MLDTDTCIDAMRGHREVLRNLLGKSRSDVGISAITEAELRFGAAKSAAPARDLGLVQSFLKPLQILEFASADAVAYAGLRARLERAGTPIGPLDTLLASQAVARRLILVSKNRREFSRVPGLHLETWAG